MVKPIPFDENKPLKPVSEKDEAMEQKFSVIKNDNRIMNETLQAVKNAFCELTGVSEPENEKLYKYWLTEVFDKAMRIKIASKEGESHGA